MTFLAAGCGSSQTGETVTVAAGTTTVTETATETSPTTTVTVTKKVVKPPPSSGVKVDYGEWEGLFKIYGARLTSSYGTPSVLGQFEYLGGGDCDLDYVEVSATFFGSGGKIVSTGLWNSTTVPKGTRLPMDLSSIDEVRASRAELVVTGATCK